MMNGPQNLPGAGRFGKQLSSCRSIGLCLFKALKSQEVDGKIFVGFSHHLGVSGLFVRHGNPILQQLGRFGVDLQFGV